MSQKSKVELPPVGHDGWKSGALALLAVMTPAGQRSALKTWATISKRDGGPFTPALPAPKTPTPTP